MAEKWSSLITEFINVTGAPNKIAKSLLEATNGNLEMAIEMHFDSCTGEDGGSSSTAVGSTSQGQANETPKPSVEEEEEVRAPIPQTRGILVDQPYHSFATRKKASTSVFDAFRDFQAEAKEQEQQAAGASSSSKRKTLQDLFRPPIDLLHKGTFETGKVAGQQQKKWLLVNVQDVQEFRCQQLNRDVWSNRQVRSVIKEHFVLWQVYRDTDEGERFIQFYHVAQYPYIGIVDPRTGEKLTDWGFMDAQAFCENVTEFLMNHTGLDGDSPPMKKAKRESIVDASEDSQLEAAIAASLRYSTSTKDDDDASDNCDDDDDDLEFSDSDNEEDGWKPQKISKPNTKPKTSTTVNKLCQNDKPSTSSKFKESLKESGTCYSSNSSSTKTSIDKRDNGALSVSSTAGKGLSNTVTTSTASTANSSVSSTEDSASYKRWQEEAGPMSKIMLRFPNGGRKQVCLQAEAPLMALVHFAQSEGYANERYELVTNFPRKRLSLLDFDMTLKAAGLFPHETVFVQER